MPVESLEEEGLPRNPNLEIAQWKFTVINPDAVEKEVARKKLLDAIKENGKYHKFHTPYGGKFCFVMLCCSDCCLIYKRTSC